MSVLSILDDKWIDSLVSGELLGAQPVPGTLDHSAVL